MEKRKVHFMGLGGAGISAVAALAEAAGYEISGCDTDQSSPFLKNLLSDGVKFSLNHDKNHLENIDYLVVSPAIESIDPNNQELSAAKNANIPTLFGEEFLAKYLIKDKKVIAVSGTHGKSTTTAMVGKILEESSLDPSVVVGAIVTDWGKNYRIGKGDYFVIEADEYQSKFLLYHPNISIITAVEMDHPEFFQDIGAINKAFSAFANQTQEYLILGEKITLEINNSDLKILQFNKDFPSRKFNLQMIGEFNQDNANLAFEASKLVGIEETQITKSLENFAGIARRFDFKGESKEIKVFDDYAHHPTAIKATLEAAVEKFPDQKIYLVYQPHMFSRTKKLFDQFVTVFKNLAVEETILVDIYAARQENKENISSRDIVETIDSPKVIYIENFEKTVGYLAKKLLPHDIVIVMGAGDIYKLSPQLLTKLNG